jgi:hypothetical protein
MLPAYCSWTSIYWQTFSVVPQTNDILVAATTLMHSPFIAVLILHNASSSNAYGWRGVVVSFRRFPCLC